MKKIQHLTTIKNGERREFDINDHHIDYNCEVVTLAVDNRIDYYQVYSKLSKQDIAFELENLHPNSSDFIVLSGKNHYTMISDGGDGWNNEYNRRVKLGYIEDSEYLNK